MGLTHMKKLRIAILTGSGKTIVEPLLKNNVDIVGISEVSSEYSSMHRFNKWMEDIYWNIIRRQKSPHLVKYANAENIPYIEKNTITEINYKKWLKSLDLDLLILHHCPILPHDLFSIPKFGAINIHPALLPKYRGPNPFFWLYYNLDMTAGVTLHFVDSNVDTGNIINQRHLDIEIGNSALEIEAELYRTCVASMLIEAISHLESKGKINTVLQPKESPTVYAKRVSDDEYYELVSNPNLTIEHFWHTLNSNDQWRKVFLSKIKYHKLYNWSLCRYERKHMNEPYYSVRNDVDGVYIPHVAGAIYLKRKFCYKKLIKALLKHS